MDDASLVAAAASGDRDAWGAIYDRYADKLHDFCWSVLRDHHEAADALHDAFITAAERIGQLRDPSRLRPWLYSICRTTCLAKARRRSKAVPTEDVEVMTPATFDDVTGGAGGAELRTLVWDAAAGLAAEDRALLDLHLRQGLDGADLGEALGISAHNATVRLGRVRDLVERSLGALLVSRAGRRDCPELDGLLTDWDGSLTPLLRKRVARHIDGCPICGERKRSMVSPMALLASVPMLGAPAMLRERVLDDVQLVSATRGVDSTDDGTFRKGWHRIVAAAALIAAVIGVAVLTSDASDDAPNAPPGAVESTTTSTTAVESTSTSVGVVAPVTARPRPRVTTTTAARPTTTAPPTTTSTVPPTTTTTRGLRGG
jgi:RNA polymerase sigma factor (sigma-70 family)